MEQSNEEVGRYIYGGSATKLNDFAFFDRLLPSGPSEEELQAFVRQLPQAYRSAYNTPPQDGVICLAVQGSRL